MITILTLFCVVIVGLSLGSFSSALSYRVPLKKPWAFHSKKVPRSQCPHCGETLGVRNLIPVLSWVFQKGRCHSCKEKISLLYPVSEVGALIACLATFFVYGFEAQGFMIMAVIPFLVALIVIDIRHMLLPNQLVFVCLVLGLISVAISMVRPVFVYGSPIEVAFHNSGADLKIYGMIGYSVFALLLGAITGFVLKKEALGMGDVKFFAVAGLWLGIEVFPFFAMVSGVFGVFLALSFNIVARKTSSETQGLFPFGPALILTLFILLLFQGSHLL